MHFGVDLTLWRHEHGGARCYEYYWPYYNGIKRVEGRRESMQFYKKMLCKLVYWP